MLVLYVWLHVHVLVYYRIYNPAVVDCYRFPQQTLLDCILLDMF